MKNYCLLFLFPFVAGLSSVVSSFTPPQTAAAKSSTKNHAQQQQQQTLMKSSKDLSLLFMKNNDNKVDNNDRDDDDDNNNNKNVISSSSSCWNPQLRRIMASVASLGALETAYLTNNKLSGANSELLFCGINNNNNVGGGVIEGSSCASVLTGPYSNVPFTDIPLAAVGFVAYSITIVLALLPLIQSIDNEKDDTINRILLTSIVTAMGTFSVFLMSLLFGVLKTSCPFCILSAGLSIFLASIAWFGDCLPTKTTAKATTTTTTTTEGFKTGATAALGSFVATVLGALILFISAPDNNSDWSNNLMASATTTTTTTTETTTTTTSLKYPPPITTTSSERAILLSKSLQSLDAKMFGAYWCSHCYDQKLTFGKEAFSNIKYIECSKEGVNSQTKLCRAKDIPGYPTWEIQGKLYPGEQELEELELIVAELKQ